MYNMNINYGGFFMKLIFLDADGTLFHSKGYIPNSAKEAISKAKQNGHKIILCTGRQESEIYGDLCSIDYDGQILGSGALIKTNDCILENNVFSNEQIDRIITYAISYNLPIIFESNQGLYINKEGMEKLSTIYHAYNRGLSNKEKSINGVTRLYSTVIPSSYEEIKQATPNKVTFLESDIPYQKIKDDLKEEFDIVQATFAPFGKESGEIADLSISKAHGMKTFIDYFNAKPEDVIAIGDGENDIPMFLLSHISIAMGNALPVLKEMADYVTTSIDEDGIYNAFTHYHLI